MYIYMHIYIYIHIHTYTCTHIHIYIYIYVYVYIHTYIHTYIHAYIHTYVCMYVCMYIYICIYISLSLYIYIYIYTHTCVYIYRHTYTYRLLPMGAERAAPARAPSRLRPVAPALKIHQRGVQWKQDVVMCMLLYTILFYNTTAIHCNEYPGELGGGPLRCRRGSPPTPTRRRLINESY